jgi:hypothetical protein
MKDIRNYETLLNTNTKTQILQYQIAFFKIKPEKI